MNGCLRKENKMKICVQGTWHLGSVTAACLADKGHKVIGLDYDTNVINSLSKGKAPIYEPGLDDLIGKGLAEKRLSFVDRPIDKLLIKIYYGLPMIPLLMMTIGQILNCF